MPGSVRGRPSRAGGADPTTAPVLVGGVGGGCDDRRMWELAHRTRDAATATMVRSSAVSGDAAIAEVRASMPEDHVILYVLEVERDES